MSQNQLNFHMFYMSGVKAHAEILRLVVTLLVRQLIRVKKLEVGRLLESLLRLKESQQPRYQRTSLCGVVIYSCIFGSVTFYSSPFRPMYWEAVKRAVEWACRTDRQYPCVYSRLEIGRDWESSTRQLLGCDSPHPFSPLKPVLERRMGVSVMYKLDKNFPLHWLIIERLRVRVSFRQYTVRQVKFLNTWITFWKLFTQFSSPTFSLAQQLNSYVKFL